MTSNRKAKTAARALAAESGRSYTHARRVDSGPADSAPAVDERLAELHREALAFARLLEEADPFLIPWGQAARRLAEVDDPAEFHTGAVRLAWDVDNLRATPNGHRCDALFRWHDNPVGIGHALAGHARAVALDRCEVDEHDQPCDGPRTLTLSVWTVDGLSEVWEPLCIGHAVSYAQRWDPSYAELVISGEPEHDARNAVARLLSTRPGEMNVRMPGARDDKHGRRIEAAPAVVDDRDDDNAAGGECDECGLPADECGCGGQAAGSDPYQLSDQWRAEDDTCDECGYVLDDCVCPPFPG